MWKNSIPLALLCLYLVKIIGLGASWQDSPLVLGLIALSYFANIVPPRDKLKELEQKLAEYKKDNEEIRSYIQATKLANNFKSVNGGR